MSDWGRIHRKFWNHPKVRQAGPTAIGLWTVCNSWSRDHRTKGFIPDDMEYVAKATDTVQALVDARLWIRVDGGYRFNDWEDWNGDVQPRTLAGRLVQEILRPEHPESVKQQLAGRVAELLEEGQETKVLAAALKLWDERPNAGPALLPHLVSDALRKQLDGDLMQLIDDCYKTGDVTPLRRWGYWFQEPDDIPLEITTSEGMRAFMTRQKREWLKKLQETLR